MRSAAVIAFALAACRSDDGLRTLARPGKHAELLGTADGRVYWTDGDTLNWADTSTGEQRAIDLPGAERAQRDSALVTPGRVLFFHHESIAWVEIGPGPKPSARDRWVSLGGHPAGFTVDGDCVYVLHTAVDCTGRGAIIGVPLVDGATCPRLDVPADGLQPRPFAADAERFYWASNCPRGKEGIYAADRATGLVTGLLPGEDVSGDLHRGALGLYWRNRQGVRRSAVNAPAPATIAAGASHCLIVDRGTLYICRDDGIHWMNEGATDDRLLAGTAGVRALAVDARHLYWLTPTGDLVRSRRP